MVETADRSVAFAVQKVLADVSARTRKPLSQLGVLGLD